MDGHEENLPSGAGRLIEAAKEASRSAYAPYSRFPVGAAVLGASGALYTGANVENASYPVGLCAERAAVAAARTHGEQRLVAVAVAPGRAGVDDLPPCGMCLQFLGELDPELVVVMKERGRWVSRPLSALLAAPFVLPLERPRGPVRAAADGAAGGAAAHAEAPGVEGLVWLERIRRPTPEQLAELAAYEEAAFGSVGLRAVDLAVMAEAGAVYRAWYEDGTAPEPTLIGSCQLLRSVDEPRTLYLVGLQVRTALRARGMGRLMLLALIRQLPRLAADDLLLTVSPANAAALALYRGAGFLDAGEVPAFYGPGEDRLLLRYQTPEV